MYKTNRKTKPETKTKTQNKILAIEVKVLFVVN